MTTTLTMASMISKTIDKLDTVQEKQAEIKQRIQSFNETKQTTLTKLEQRVIKLNEALAKAKADIIELKAKKRDSIQIELDEKEKQAVNYGQDLINALSTVKDNPLVMGMFKGNAHVKKALKALQNNAPVTTMTIEQVPENAHPVTVTAQ